MYFTYVLKCCDGHLYVGSTGDLRNRLEDHHNGRVFTTQNRRPLELVYYEACLSKTNALVRERQLKTGFGRSYLKRRLADMGQ